MEGLGRLVEGTAYRRGELAKDFWVGQGLAVRSRQLPNSCNYTNKIFVRPKKKYMCVSCFTTYPNLSHNPKHFIAFLKKKLKKKSSIPTYPNLYCLTLNILSNSKNIMSTCSAILFRWWILPLPVSYMPVPTGTQFILCKSSYFNVKYYVLPEAIHANTILFILQYVWPWNRQMLTTKTE